jgi:hypothetical protein
MITENQLRALDFEYNEDSFSWIHKDITVEFDSELQSGYKITFIPFIDFELQGINDHRDLSKFIKLVYGE